MPAPDRQGMPTVRSLDSDEAGAWVRLLLYGSTSALEGRRVLATFLQVHMHQLCH